MDSPAFIFYVKVCLILIFSGMAAFTWLVVYAVATNMYTDRKKAKNEELRTARQDHSEADPGQLPFTSYRAWRDRNGFDSDPRG